MAIQSVVAQAQVAAATSPAPRPIHRPNWDESRLSGLRKAVSDAGGKLANGKIELPDNRTISLPTDLRDVLVHRIYRNRGRQRDCEVALYWITRTASVNP